MSASSNSSPNSDSPMESSISPGGTRSTAKNLTAQEKLTAIHRVRNGESKASVARSISVPESTLRGWCKNEERIFYLSSINPITHHATPWLPQETYNNCEVLDYRKEVLDSKLTSFQKRQSKGMKLNHANKTSRVRSDFPYLNSNPRPNTSRTETFSYNTHNGILSNNATFDKFLEAQWIDFLMQRLDQKKMDQSEIVTTDTNASNKENIAVFPNPYWSYNWYGQYYRNQQAQYQEIARAEMQQRMNQEATIKIKNYVDHMRAMNCYLQQRMNQLHKNDSGEAENENNKTDDEKDTNCCPQQEFNQLIEESPDETIKEEHDTDKEINEDIDRSAALRHGEKFLEWLQNCRDPNVTALQVLRFKMLLHKLDGEMAENEK